MLRAVRKGVDVAGMLEAGRRIVAAGFDLWTMVLIGLAGQGEASRAHALDTAAALSAMKPEYIGLLTLRVYHGTPLAQWVQEGTLTQLDPLQLAAETRLLIEHLDSEGSVFRANHASNYLILKGTLNRDKAALLKKIDAALEGKQPFRRFVELGF